MVEFRIDIFVSKTLYRLIELLVSLAKGQRGTSDLSRERTGVSRAFFHPVLASASHLNWVVLFLRQFASKARQWMVWWNLASRSSPVVI